MQPSAAAAGTTVSRAGGVTKPKVNSACEACRAAKVKCQPSLRSGICQRCLEFKRECIFRTGPRTRRPRQPKVNGPATALRAPAPPGPSKTFSINFDMPAQEEASLNAFVSLAQRHESYIESLLPEVDDTAHTPMYDDLMMNALNSFHHSQGISMTPPMTHGHSAPSSHSSSSHPHSHRHHHFSHPVGDGTVSSHTQSASSAVSSPSVVPISNVGLKPQFNLDSATKLLGSFRDMLTHFPCIVLPEEVTVSSLAATRPFVLLAILSVASGAGALQGHSLYDEEFRKILGLKFVAGGERSVELLQGLLIYTAWFPFHLRPKNKQAFQYIRMAAEIAHDLELVFPPENSNAAAISEDAPLSEEQAEGMRTYLSCYYLVTTFLATWPRFSVLNLEFSHWTATCCDVLERSSLSGDQALSWLARCAHIADETSKVDKMKIDDGAQGAQRINFLLLGLEAQFQDWKSRIPPSLISGNTSVSIITALTDVALHAAPILRVSGLRSGEGQSAGTHLPPDPAKLAYCIPILRGHLDQMESLESSEFVPLTSTDWGKLIMGCIIALRLSMPLPNCPEWNHAQARESLRFGSFLNHFTGDDVESEGLDSPATGASSRDAGSFSTPSSSAAGSNGTRSKMDVLTASKIVFGVVKRKYLARLSKLESEKSEMALTKDDRGCPMLDGSLDSYFSEWDPDLNAGTSASLDWMGQALALEAPEVYVDGLNPGDSETMQNVMDLNGSAPSGGTDVGASWAGMSMNWTEDDIFAAGVGTDADADTNAHGYLDAEEDLMVAKCSAGIHRRYPEDERGRE